MQRGGSWDNSDIKGAKRKRWLKEDKEYDEQAFQSASIFGGENLPWNTKVKNRGRNAMTDAEMWRAAGAVKVRHARMHLCPARHHPSPRATGWHQTGGRAD